MPKKTKKEKLLAAHHRMNLPPVVSADIRALDHTDTANTFRLTMPVQKTIYSQNAISASVDEFAAIKHDLIKTLIITISIISSEFLLAHYLPH